MSDANIEDDVRNKCSAFFEAEFCECVNPEGSCSGGAKLILTIVSEKFQGKMPLARHRMVNKLLEQELADGSKIHALTINAWTISQWEKKKGER